jgi:Linear amide C-N hydrolases, choloylglycine hydrolase family
MVRPVLVLACLALLVLGQAGGASAKKFEKTPEMMAQLRVLGHLFRPHPRTVQTGVGKGKPGDIPFDCAMCSILVSEVWGQLEENHTVEFIQKKLKTDICNHLSSDAQYACDKFVQMLPEIANALESRDDVSQVCMDFGFCAKPYVPHKDPIAVPHLAVDLGTSPDKRFTAICSNETLMAGVRFVVATIRGILPGHGEELGKLGEYINDHFPPEYAAEIAGCARAAGGVVSVGWMSIFNLGYEVSDACTSTIVTDSKSGKPLHGRNLDFFTGGGFTDSLKESAMQVAFQSKGKTQYEISMFPGFVGALSILKTGVASVTIDTRFNTHGVEFLFYEILYYMEERNASMVTFLARDAVETSTTWSEVVQKLSTVDLVADVYYTCAGVEAGHGVVIARSPTNATRTWKMDAPKAGPQNNGPLEAPSGPFLLETNYDWWVSPPWFDDRRDPGIKHVQEVPKGHMDRDALWKVMSTKPTFNAQTTWTNILNPSTGHMETWARWCNLDNGCVQ